APLAGLAGRPAGRAGGARLLLRGQHDLLPAPRVGARDLPSAPRGERGVRPDLGRVLPDRAHLPARLPPRAPPAEPHRRRALRLLPAGPEPLPRLVSPLRPAARLLLAVDPGRLPPVPGGGPARDLRSGPAAGPPDRPREPAGRPRAGPPAPDAAGD